MNQNQPRHPVCASPDITRRIVFPVLAVIGCVVAATLAAPAAAQEFQPPYSGFSDPSTAFPYGAALEGLGVVVSAGHGWEGGTDGGFQRSRYQFDGCGSCDGITEDLYNAELVSDHLIPMLRGAGARVYVARQPDRNPVGLEVDDGELAYGETGQWADGANVELGWGADYRTHSVTYPGTATWSFYVATAGDYWVQARWAAGTNRCAVVRYTVRHAGGTAEFVVDQREDGSMWVHLGRLHFAPGEALVTVDAPGGTGCYLIADAVRLGGGTDPESGHPWWHVGAYQWLDETGPSSLGAFNEVTIRPELANVVGADYYVSIHADASDTGSVTGTSTYRYNCGSGVWYQPLDPATCNLPSGSAEFQYAVQDRFIADVRADWDPAWGNRGKLVGDYGELRPLSGIPGILFESAFFTNLATNSGARMSDNQAMHDPRFRRIAARALVRGLISVADPTAVFPPEPPTHLVVRDVGGLPRVSWRPSSGASGYRVYVAVDGRGYDGGRFTTSTSLALSDASPGTVVLVRVTAINAGGESTASDAVAASVSSTDSAAVLVVNAFDRLDAWVREDANRRDYSFEHGIALASAGIGFDGASDEAVTGGDVPLAGYQMMDWILGRESTGSGTFDAAAQSVVQDFLSAGGCVVASGTEIAWDLGNLGSGADQLFLAGGFGAGFGADDAGTRSVQAEPSGPFDGLPAFSFDDGSGGIYNPRFPDVLTAVSGGVPALRYSSGGIAAVARIGAPGRSVLAGFPFETIVDVGARTSLLQSVTTFCGVGVVDTGDEPEVAEIPDVAESHDVVDQPDAAEDAIAVDDLPVADTAGTDVSTEDALLPRDPGTDPVDAPGDVYPDVAATDFLSRDAAMYDARGDLAWLTDLAGAGNDAGGDESGGSGGCSSSGQDSWPVAYFLLLVLPAVLAVSRRSRRC